MIHKIQLGNIFLRKPRKNYSMKIFFRFPTFCCSPCSACHPVVLAGHHDHHHHLNLPDQIILIFCKSWIAALFDLIEHPGKKRSHKTSLTLSWMLLIMLLEQYLHQITSVQLLFVCTSCQFQMLSTRQLFSSQIQNNPLNILQFLTFFKVSLKIFQLSCYHIYDNIWIF